MSTLITYLINRSHKEDGQALAEVTLIMTFVVAVCIIAVTFMGLAVLQPLTNFMNGID
jgi:hypothetical protein